MFGLRCFLPPDYHALWQLVWRIHCKACALPIRRTKHKRRTSQHKDSIEQGHLMSPWSRNPNDPACPTGQLPHHFLIFFLVTLCCNHKVAFSCLCLLTLAYTPVAFRCCGLSHRTIESPHGWHVRPRHAAKVCRGTSGRTLRRTTSRDSLSSSMNEGESSFNILNCPWLTGPALGICHGRF